MRAISILTDGVIGKLFQFLDARLGMKNVVVVMTADHGVSPVPEVNQARRMPGGRMPPGIVKETVQAALAKKFGAGNWIANPDEHSLYLNVDLIREKKLDRTEVDQAAAAAAMTIPHVFRAITASSSRTASPWKTRWAAGDERFLYPAER